MGATRGKLVATASVVLGSLVAALAGGLALEDHVARTALLERIAVLEDAVPVELVSVERSTDDIARDAERCEDICRQFLARWPGREEAWRVKGTLLRMLRFLEGRGDSPLRGGGPAAEEALRKREARKAEAADLARALLRRRDIGPAERHAAFEVLLEREPEVFGGLERIAALLGDIGAEYARRIGALPDGPPRKRLEYRRDSAEFLLSQVWLGLAKYPEALRIRRETAARRSGAPTADMYQRFLEGLAGRTPEAGLLDAVWATPSRFSLEEARGSVVVLMTHGPQGPEPNDEALEALGRVVAARRAGGLVGIAVRLYDEKRGDEAAAKAARDLKEDLDRLRIPLPGAVLPTARLGGLFPRSCSGTTVVLDRRGQFVWCAALFGPESAEWSLTRLVLDRCLAEGRTAPTTP